MIVGKITAEQLRRAADRIEEMSDEEFKEFFLDIPRPVECDFYATLERLICGSSRS